MITKENRNDGMVVLIREGSLRFSTSKSRTFWSQISRKNGFLSLRNILEAISASTII